MGVYESFTDAKELVNICSGDRYRIRFYDLLVDVYTITPNDRPYCRSNNPSVLQLLVWSDYPRDMLKITWVWLKLTCARQECELIKAFALGSGHFVPF